MVDSGEVVAVDVQAQLAAIRTMETARQMEEKATVTLREVASTLANLQQAYADILSSGSVR